jgi:hypothetical protein
MADENADLFAEFQEFLTQKRQAEKDEQSAEDFEVEIWDKDGRGVRTRRSHAKPFLQSLGIDVDTDPESDKGDGTKSDGKSDGKGAGKPTGSQRNATGTQSTVRKYFTKNPVK